jgi:signal transduction histidine kinase
MSVLTALLEKTPHFGLALKGHREVFEESPQTENPFLQLLWDAYCYAHVALPKAIALADEIINGSATNNLKGYAYCVKAMSLNRMGYTDRAKTAGLHALGIFEALKDPSGMSEAYFQLGIIKPMGISSNETSEYIQLALEGYQRSGNTTGYFMARILQNSCFVARIEPADSLQAYQSLLTELPPAGYPHLLCMTYSYISFNMYLMQDMHGYKQYMKKWQELALTTGNFHDYTLTKTMLTECNRMEQLDKKIMQECLESIKCCEQLGSFYGYASTAVIMGKICMDQSQYQEAFDYFQKANESALEIQDAHLCNISLIGVGLSLFKSSKMDEARKIFEQVLDKATQTGDKINQVAAQRHLAEVSLEQLEFDNAFRGFKRLFDMADIGGLQVMDYGKFAFSISKASDETLCAAGIDKANRNETQLSYLQKHLEVALQQEHKRETANAYSYLSDYYETTGLLGEALRFRKLYISLCEQIMNEHTTDTITQLRIQYETEKKDTEIALLKKEKQEVLLLERLRLSRDLHDDIGSTLSSIHVYSDIAAGKLRKNQTAETFDVLQKMGDASRMMAERMSDLVWSINPEHDGLQSLIDRMKSFAAIMLDGIETDYTFPTGAITEQVRLDIGQRKNLFLICKEAINNIAKYAACSKVNISLALQKKALILKFEDNGKGFDPEHIPSGLGGSGIPNMSARAGALGGTLQLWSEHGQGTCVTLMCTVNTIVPADIPVDEKDGKDEFAFMKIELLEDN